MGWRPERNGHLRIDLKIDLKTKIIRGSGAGSNLKSLKIYANLKICLKINRFGECA